MKADLRIKNIWSTDIWFPYYSVYNWGVEEDLPLLSHGKRRS
jgi:hypothetical protein